MVVRRRAGTQAGLLAAFLTCWATAVGVSQVPAEQSVPPSVKSNPTVERSSQSADQEPSIPDLQEKSWLILQSGLRKKKVAECTEAVKALSLLAGNRQARSEERRVGKEWRS